MKPTSSAGVLLLLALVVLGGVVLVGGFGSNNLVTTSQLTAGGTTCCNSGDGANCHTDSSKTFTYKGQQYGLIKSAINLIDFQGHLKSDGTTPDGHQIYINTTETTRPGNECTTQKCTDPSGKCDSIWNFSNCNPTDVQNGTTSCVNSACYLIPDDEVIYTCSKDKTCNPTPTTLFDAYFRTRDTIPDVIKNCYKGPFPINDAPGNSSNNQQLVLPTITGTQKNLQLNTFKIIQDSINPWLSPYCKPAIYLYPKEKTNVTVQIAPKGELGLTIPTYSLIGGWNVTVFPNGNILSQGKTYPYLYYEAHITDSAIEEPQEGFVVSSNSLLNFFDTTLPKLGLNNKEQKDFSDYWLKALPKSPYYLVKVIPVSNLNSISPLSITPVPQTTIRITLYFEPLDKKITVKEPQLPNMVKRNGFTVVEWGGLYKKDANHPFTCFQ